jgi:AcrR family transcriptional regulator
MKSQVRTLSRQERTEVTRARLIESAEKIFARDGFEVAKLEEIAADAGYTRGAFYANFQSKEDLFLALLEREASSRIENARKQLDKTRGSEAKLQAMRAYFMRKSLDRRWSLLSLEFKLFAIRHPGVKNRLAAINRRFIFSWVDTLEEMVKAVGHQLAASTPAVGMSLPSLSNSLTIEHMLDRTLMSGEDVEKILGSFFDCMTGGHAPAGKTKGSPTP